MSRQHPPRIRSVPARFDDEQASAFILAQIASAERNPTTMSMDESTSEEETGDESGPEEGEERKESDRRPPGIEWSTQYTPVQPLAFSPPRRPAHSHDQCNTPIEFLQLFITNQFIDACVDYTNSYAEQRYADDSPRLSSSSNSNPSHQWQSTTGEEIKAMLGCLIYMGIVQLNDTRDYWSGITAQSFVSSTFTRDRFLELITNFRVSGEIEVADGEGDKLIKIRQLIDVMISAFTRNFYPGEEVSIDEVMILFKGRSSMRQHIAKKKSPTGFKVWTLVDIGTNYIYYFDIYQGKEKVKTEEGMTRRLVHKLISVLEPHCYHRIGMDGFFTSVQLFRELERKGFYAVGTTRHNRFHFPKVLLEEVKSKDRGEWVWRQCDNLVCISWMDKKPVNLLSTFCDPTKVREVERRTGRDVIKVKCPEVLPAYLRTMRGADVFAQRQSYSKIGRRSKKWFYSLIWFLLDTAIPTHSYYTRRRQRSIIIPRKSFVKQ